MKIKEVNSTYLPTRLSTEYLFSQKWQLLLMALCRAIEYNIPYHFLPPDMKVFSRFLPLKIIFMHIPECMRVCAICCRSPWKSEEGARSSGPEVAFSFESPCGFLKPHSNPLQEQQMLLLELYFKLVLASWIVLYGSFRRLHPNSERHKYSDLMIGVMSY